MNFTSCDHISYEYWFTTTRTGFSKGSCAKDSLSYTNLEVDNKTIYRLIMAFETCQFVTSRGLSPAG